MSATPATKQLLGLNPETPTVAFFVPNLLSTWRLELLGRMKARNNSSKCFFARDTLLIGGRVCKSFLQWRDVVKPASVQPDIRLIFF